MNIEKRRLELAIEQAQKEVDDIKNNVIYQNAFEWRFEFPEVLDENGNFIGFDLIIGNPPYGVSVKGNERKKLTDSLGKVPDFEIFYYFINLGHNLLKTNFNLSYIIPNSILFNVFAEKYRKALVKNWHINEILDCTDFSVFDEATVRNIVFLFTKERDSIYFGYRNTFGINNFSELLDNELLISNTNYLNEFIQNWGLAFKLKKETKEIIRKIISNSTTKLEYLFPEISQGLIAYDKYKGQDKYTIENRVFHSFKKENENFKRWLWGSDVTPYFVEWNGKEYINYNDNIANPRQPKFFNNKRVLVREITNPKIYAGLTSEENYNDPSLLIILSNKRSEVSIESLLGFLNSKLVTFYHFNFSPKASKGLFPKILITDLKKIPINKQIKILDSNVKEILNIKQRENIDTSTLENEIDIMVFKLYELTYEEVLRYYSPFVRPLF